MENQLAVVTDNDLVSYLDAMGLASKLSEKEKLNFLKISKAYGLNPFKREIYVSKYGENLSIITGYEVYLKRAERTGLLDGWKVESFGDVASGNLKAVCTIYRKDRQHPFVHEVDYDEYVQRTRDGIPNKFWKEKPKTMTKKVAISQAFRMCFSDELGGMPYTAEEIGHETTIDTTHEVVQPTAPQIDYKALIESCETREQLENVWKQVPTSEKKILKPLATEISLKLKANE